jgi:hypothetical protein
LILAGGDVAARRSDEQQKVPPRETSGRRASVRDSVSRAGAYGAGMATRVKPTTGQLYEQDFYAWTKTQAGLLRAGRYADLDLAHLIEEVDDLGESLKRSVRSRIRTIIEHLLKLEHSPARRPRGGWYDSILAQRSDLLDELTPSIRRDVEPALPDLYDRACQNAAASLSKHGEPVAADALPATCSYTLDQITGDWLP